MRKTKRAVKEERGPQKFLGDALSGRRMLHNNICESRKLSAISFAAETLYYRLLTQVDDAGNFFGEPAIIKGRCVPLRMDISVGDVSALLDELIGAELVFIYESGGEKYAHIERFGDFQKLRQDRNPDIKYPVYNELVANGKPKETPDTGRQTADNQMVPKKKLREEKLSKDNVGGAVCDSQKLFTEAKRRFRRIVGVGLGSLGSREREWSGLVARFGADVVLEAVEIWAREKKTFLKTSNFPLAHFLKNASEFVDAVLDSARKSATDDEEETMPTVEDIRPPDYVEQSK